MKISVIVLALLAVFNGAVWAALGGLSLSAHGLGILNIIVGLVVVFIELFVAWHPWNKA